MGGTIVVTGASGGLGLAIVAALRRSGYDPVLTGRDGEKVAKRALELDVPGYRLDVSDAAQIGAVCDEIARMHGPVYGLVNNAGIWLEGDLESCREEDIGRVIGTNTTGTILMTRALLPDMLARGRGVVVNVVSAAALYTRKSLSVYAASKWAIRGFTGCLEAECAPKGVRVMGFYPGKIDTGMYRRAGVARDLSVAMSPEQGAEAVLAMIRDEGMVWGQVAARSIDDYG